MISFIKPMKNSIFLLGLLLFSFQLFKTLKIEKEANLIGVDSLGKIYQVDNKMVQKYDAEGKKIANYALLNTGTITSIDTRNALQTLLFFEDQQQIVLLDNMLGVNRQIELKSYFDWIDLACLSNRDNAFWLYSINSQSLIKVNNELQEVKRLDNIGQLLNLDIQPIQLIEKGEKVYLLDRSFGVIVFDIFGNYLKTIPIKNAQKIRVDDEQIIYLVENTIKGYNQLTFDKLDLFESDSITDFCNFGSKLYVQEEKRLISIEVRKQ